MFSKAKKTERIDPEQREQYEYARRRIKQKKSLMRHFIFFLAGCILFIILDEFLKVGEDLLKNWYIWAILIWTFIFLIHLLNVFVMNTFMGKEWEDKQMEKLKAKQVNRIAELQKKVNTELQLPTNAETPTKRNELNNPLPPDVQ